MRTMREAKKASGKSEVTGRHFASVHVTTRTSTPFRDLVKAGKRKTYGLLSENATSEPDESTWGWVKRHRFDPRFGTVEVDED